MYDVLTIAQYILYFAYKRGDLITNLKLQKLLYYLQAWYVVKNKGQPLFKESIEAWQYGPVVKEVYEAYKCFGRNPINDESLPNEFNLSKNVTECIDSVLNAYMDYSASTLVQSIHQDLPWQEAYSSQTSPKIIKLETMYNFYKDRFMTKREIEEQASIPLEGCVTLQ